jgi:hypothetical protein
LFLIDEPKEADMDTDEEQWTLGGLVPEYNQQRCEIEGRMSEIDAELSLTPADD